MGRPPMWDDPVKFEEQVDKYFETEISPTWTGLAIHLGFESRQSLEDYKKKEGFAYPIKKALLRIENQYEKAVFGKNPAGPIFALKNFGWKDRQEIDQKTEISGSLAFSGIQIVKPNDPDTPDIPS
jgi:hypothetical protein